MAKNLRIPMGTRLFHEYSKMQHQHLRTSHSQSSSNDNNEIEVEFVNNNPRSMEMLRIHKKPKGWHLDSPNCSFWYKLMLDCSNRHVCGQVVHYTGKTVVSASTQEWAIKKHLYSTNDVSAYENVGRILAHRCLQSGISEIHTDLTVEGESSEKIRYFMEALKSGGIETEEPDVIHEHYFFPWSKRKTGLPWEVNEEKVLEHTEEKNKNNK